jgi:spore coat protein JB
MNDSRQDQLMKQINEANFTVNDLTLYLDTHPEDQDALKLFHQSLKQKKEAAQEYEKLYGPLEVCMTSEETGKWTWGSMPAPWEGGTCQCGTMKSGSNTL